MGTRLGTALLACLAAMAALGPGVSYADSVATTGGVTSVTSSSALLHGLANTSGTDSEWFFQYGTAADALSSTTTPQALETTGLTAVERTVVNLTAKTTYFYRLVVVSQSYNSTPHYGDTFSFTASGAGQPSGPPPGSGAKTKVSYGVGSVSLRTLAVRHGFVTIPVRCAGARGSACKGKVALSAKGKHHHTVSCAGGKFSATAGHSARVRSRLSRGCRALLAAARGHRLSATLKATFSTHQRGVKKSVILLG
jgi:hypothetical protein